MMSLLQAVPPVPPVPPIQLDPNLFGPRMDSAAIIMVVFLIATAVTLVCWPIARALARRLEGKSGVTPSLQGELDQVHDRLAEMDGLQQRVAELEERLEFAERMLAQAREPDRLQR
jgi:Tfp pilus assembly protein PilO